MAFSAKSFEQILADQINYVRARTTLTDFNVGSVIRTILEASSLEDDEIYHQMVELLKQYSYLDCDGTELVRRGADFNESKLEENESSGPVYVVDNDLERTYLAVAVTVGNVNIEVVDATVFAAIGFPFTIRIGEDSPEVEDIAVNAIVLNQLQLAAGTVFAHPAAPLVVTEYTAGASRVSYVSGAADRTLPTGLGNSRPSTGIVARQNFLTTETATHYNGDFLSDVISARSINKGKIYNAPAETITEFTANPPFTNAGVINLSTFGGGRDLETDDEFRDRLFTKIASLMKATILAIQSATTGVEVVSTGQTVTRSKVFEDWIDRLVRVYINDGTSSFSPDTSSYAQTVLAANPAPNPGAAVLQLTSKTDFPDEGFVLVDQSGTPEILEYSAIAVAGPPYNMTLVGVTAVAHLMGDTVQVVEQVEDVTEFDQRYFQLDNIALIENTFNLFRVGSGATIPTEILPVTGYFINEGVGQVQLVSAAPLSSSLYAFYNWYIALVREVHKVLDGDLDDPANYPGVRAAGIKLLTSAATSVNIDVLMSLELKEGLDATTKASLIAQAELAINGYTSSLPMGQDWIRNEVIERAMALSGNILDLNLPLPPGNVTVLDNEVAVPRNITVL